MNIQKLKGPAVIIEKLIKARADLEAELCHASSCSAQKQLTEQIAKVEFVLRDLNKELSRPKLYRELDELTDRERVMARLAKKIGRGRDVIYHGTRALPEVMRAGKLIPSELGRVRRFLQPVPRGRGLFRLP